MSTGGSRLYPSLEAEGGPGQQQRGARINMDHQQQQQQPLEQIMVEDPGQQAVEQSWKAVFDEYDTDSDGVIALTELKSRLTDQCEADRCGISASKRAKILRRADSNRDGQIDYREFARMMSREDGRMKRLVWAAATSVMPKSMQDDEFISYIDEYNCLPPPLFVILISIVEIIMYIYYAIDFDEFSADGPVPINSELIYNPHRRKEAWRYLTYMFIHVGYVHILFNVLIQIILGLPLELVHKIWRFAPIYLMGVIAGSLGTTVVDPNTYLAGASGGVYAILAAHMANVIINWKEMPYAWIRLIVLLLLGGLDIGVAIWQRYTGDADSNVGYAAHFAGALAGLLMGVMILRNLKVRTWERVMWWVCLVASIILLVFAIVWNIAYPEYFPTQTI